MMTSSNGNIFRVTDPLFGQFTGHRWIPRTKASDAELWYFLWSAPEWTVELGWWSETPPSWLWRQYSDMRPAHERLIMMSFRIVIIGRGPLMMYEIFIMEKGSVNRLVCVLCKTCPVFIKAFNVASTVGPRVCLNAIHYIQYIGPWKGVWKHTLRSHVHQWHRSTLVQVLVRCQSITWTSAELFLSRPQGKFLVDIQSKCLRFLSTIWI